MIKGTLLEPLFWWAFAAIAVTGVFAGMYLAVQQNYRQGLNDPQIQMAEDAATKLDAGASVQTVVSSLPAVDIGQSLAPYVAVFDSTGKAVSSSGYLNGALPQPPPSAIVSGWKREGAHSFFSWQPQSDVRSAVVVQPYTSGQDSGYVMAGRNMREVENRIEELTFDLALVWLFTLGCLFVASFMGWFLLRPQK